MPKSTKQKLAVDGTAKLAAKSKASDKHEAKNLSIEEATVASPRASRKRAGEFNDFDDETSANAAHASTDADKAGAKKGGKPAAKKAKTSSEPAAKKAAKEDKPAKPAAKKTKAASAMKTEDAKKSKDKEPEATSAAKEDKPKKAKAAKDESSTKKASDSKATEKKSKATKDTKSETASSEKPAKAKGGKKAAPIAPALAMDQAPLENLLDSDAGKSPAAADKDSATKPKTTKATKAKKAGNVDSKDAAAKPKKATKTKHAAADATGKAITKTKSAAAKGDASKADAPKTKKRKAGASIDAEDVKQKVLDPLSEHASESASKKQKTSRKSLTASVGEFLTSSFEMAGDAVRSSFGFGSGAATAAEGERITTITTSTSTSTSQKDKGKDLATDPSRAQPALSKQEQTTEDDDGDMEGTFMEEDDQTAALLAGFDDSDDDSDEEEDNKFVAGPSTGGDGEQQQAAFSKGQKLPSLPDAKTTAKKLKALASTKDQGNFVTPRTPGVVYVGRIPHGFYEHEMGAYFSQFGDIRRLRVSRSVKTGKSKHYAFIEFVDQDVAAIVADTMDNYLLFGHILKCKLVAPGDVHKDLFKGANKRFKVVPWNKLQGRKLAMPVGREQWWKREVKTEARRKEQAERARELMGYDSPDPGVRIVDHAPSFEEMITEAQMNGGGGVTYAVRKQEVVQGEKRERK